MQSQLVQKKRWIGLVLLLLPALVYCAAIQQFIVNDYSLYDFPLDDAWIHRVYAESLARGDGFAYNPGRQEAGSTSPLWSVVTAPAHWLRGLGDHAVVMGVKAIGVLLGLLIVYSALLVVYTLTGRLVPAVMTALVFSFEPRLLFSALSGMETLLLVALWMTALLALLRRKYLSAFCVLSLAPTARPEALVLVPLFLCAVLFCRGRTKKNMRQLLLYAALACMPMVIWGFFCMSVQGHWLPNSFYSKAAPFTPGAAQLEMARSLVVQYGYAALPLFGVGLLVCICWLAVSIKEQRLAVALVLFGAPLVYLLAVVSSRQIHPEGYYWTHWADPATIMLTLPFCMGVGLAVGTWTNRAALWPKAVFSGPQAAQAAGIIALVLVVSLASSSQKFAESFEERRTRLASDSRAINLLNVKAGRFVRDAVPSGAVVGVNDAGAIRYFGGRRTIDLLGLNCSDILFKKHSVEEMIGSSDWLVIFPSLFYHMGLYDFIRERFALREAITIPREEYTPCPCPEQATIFVYQRQEG